VPAPYRLLPQAFEKIWGSTQLAPWFPNALKKMGEFWFTEPGSSLLIKFLFTTENLSVQVHPNDAQAAELEPGSRGKTEMWHILRAEPGAKLAMGLKESMPLDQLRAACVDGSIMDRLRWLPAIAGETWYIPAGTIHAIGAGIAVAEVQQNSDVTYRLYDYGRVREMHLAKALSVSNMNYRPEPVGERVESPYFLSDILHIDQETTVGPGYLIVTGGSGELDRSPIHQGQVWHLTSPHAITGPLDAILTTETHP
jgi:mannose-6-phosphate isomerase